MESTEFIEDGFLASAGIRSYAVVPVSVGGRAIGTLEFGHHEPGFYTDRHVRLIQPIADHLAVTLSHSRLFQQVEQRAEELSGALQRVLLPVDLPRPPFVALGALYRPANPAAGIGGDWYDAVLLPGDTLMIGIGDVTGRGPAAAVGMGQVRDVTRAFAIEGRSPAEILTSVHEFLARMPGSAFLSAWVGILDPFSGTLVYAGAGHPPACVVAGGQVHPLAPSGPPLGASQTTRYSESRIVLAPGTRLIAYTDGLIEATHDILEGEQRLHRAALATMAHTPTHAVGALVDQVLDGARATDDIAVLMIDVLPPDAPLAMSVAALPENLGRIRRAVRALARRHQATDDQVEAVAIAVGEAALNAVEHAYRGRVGRLTVHGEAHGGILAITVRDYGRWHPRAERGRGRGTRIMEAFADSVKTTTGAGGTRVDLKWTLGLASHLKG
jgi:anti-sigma regulatory factor (Ser/Thr protein kinase)